MRNGHRHVCDHFPAREGGDRHWRAELATVPALPPPERRAAVTRASRYLTMRDGVRLAIDLHLPTDASIRGTRLPTILRQTRYYRSLAFTALGRRLISPDLLEGEAVTRARFLAHGYAWVDVDARGSGASFGERPHPWSHDEVQDGVEVLDWIVRQPWSNGRVGSTGVSYDGTAAEHLATRGHPALRAIAPRFSLYDVYTDIAFPGGIQLAWFTRNWSRYNRALDRGHFDEALAGTLRLFGHGVRNAPAADGRLRALAAWLDRDGTEALLRRVARRLVAGVRAVDEDARRAILDEAILSHARNHDPHADAEALVFRDDSPPGRPEFTPDFFSPHTYLADARAAGTAISSISGWHDSAYPLSAITRFRAVGSPGSRLILGPWEHGGALQTSPRGHSRLTEFDQVGELLRFFDLHLRDRDDGLGSEPPVHYFTMGEERWKNADRWPPRDVQEMDWFLAGGHALAPTAPSRGAPEAADRYRIDPTATTGPRARWDSLIGFHFTIDYPDRAAADRKLLTYTSSPLPEPLEVTGHPKVVLWLVADAPDAAIHAYLEDVDERGDVTYVTEGLLRALHRRPSEDVPPYPVAGPYSTYRRADAWPLVPGEPAEIAFALFPVSYRFERGHALRLAIAGADADHFAAVPGGASELTVLRDERHRSRLVLPVMPLR